MKHRFLLGLDPSQNGTGYAVLDCRYNTPRIAEMGVVRGRNKTWGDTPSQAKLAITQAKIKELVAKYYPLYPKVFLERGFTKYNESTQATFKARGAIETELIGFDIIEFPPSEVKRVVSGKGNADKPAIAQSVAEIFCVSLDDFETEDVSDALAVAYTGYIKHYKEEK